MNLIPAIDLMDGQCVRLFQGGFSTVTYYDFNPTDLANKYEEMGFSKLHIVDLDGSRKGFSNNSSVITEIIKSSGLIVQLGGGIRSIDKIREWIDIGVDRIILGSYAIHNINKLRNSLNDNECSKLIIALDVLFKNNLPIVMTHGWQKSSGKSLWSLLEKFNQENFDNFLVTDISKDGTLLWQQRPSPLVENTRRKQEFRVARPVLQKGMWNRLQRSSGRRHQVHRRMGWTIQTSRCSKANLWR